MFPSKLFRRSGSARLALFGVAAFGTALWLSTPAGAQERFAGEWVISHAVAAPWASDPNDRADEADARRLVGKRLAIGTHVFRAPQPLGCARPTYVFRDAAADGYFEGALDADGAGRPADPAAAGRQLGLSGETTRAMTASCSEVEFLLAYPDTILFGLNNRIFTATRAK